jgi:hypothetical protein
MPVEIFVLRVWTPGEKGDDAPTGLRGVLEHVGSEDVQTFRSATELLRHIRSNLAGRPPSGRRHTGR